MPTLKHPGDISPIALVDLLEDIQYILWFDMDRMNPNKEWNSDTASAIADAMRVHGLGLEDD